MDARRAPVRRLLPRSDVSPLQAGGKVPTGENTLFCQFAAEEVEPILSPEQFVLIHVCRGAENAAGNRLLRQRAVARRDIGLVRPRTELPRIDPAFASD